MKFPSNELHTWFDSVCHALSEYDFKKSKKNAEHVQIAKILEKEQKSEETSRYFKPVTDKTKFKGKMHLIF
jgi:hypothetical protein